MHDNREAFLIAKAIATATGSLYIAANDGTYIIEAFDADLTFRFHVKNVNHIDISMSVSSAHDVASFRLDRSPNLYTVDHHTALRIAEKIGRITS